jgi:putative membrane protein
MRTALLVTAAALALTACGPKASTNTATADSNAMAGDTMAGGGAMAGDSMAGTNTTVAANDTGGNGAMTGSASAPDFVKNAALSDMYEITSSKLAATMASSPAVKKFAANMIAAHTKTTAGLKAAIAKDGVQATPPAALDAEHQALVDALKAVKGDAFDALYKSQQTEAHTKTLALMQSYATTGDQAALKAFASDTAPKVKMHLDMLNGMS